MSVRLGLRAFTDIEETAGAVNMVFPRRPWERGAPVPSVPLCLRVTFFPVRDVLNSYVTIRVSIVQRLFSASSAPLRFKLFVCCTTALSLEVTISGRGLYGWQLLVGDLLAIDQLHGLVAHGQAVDAVLAEVVDHILTQVER